MTGVFCGAHRGGFSTKEQKSVPLFLVACRRGLSGLVETPTQPGLEPICLIIAGGSLTPGGEQGFGAFLWQPPQDPSKGICRWFESCLGYNDSRMGFYMDKQCDPRHWGHEKEHFLCSWRCELRAKEISKISTKAFLSITVSSEWQECLVNCT